MRINFKKINSRFATNQPLMFNNLGLFGCRSENRFLKNVQIFENEN